MPKKKKEITLLESKLLTLETLEKIEYSIANKKIKDKNQLITSLLYNEKSYHSEYIETPKDRKTVLEKYCRLINYMCNQNGGKNKSFAMQLFTALKTQLNPTNDEAKKYYIRALKSGITFNSNKFIIFIYKNLDEHLKQIAKPLIQKSANNVIFKYWFRLFFASGENPNRLPSCAKELARLIDDPSITERINKITKMKDRASCELRPYGLSYEKYKQEHPLLRGLSYDYGLFKDSNHPSNCTSSPLPLSYEPENRSDL